MELALETKNSTGQLNKVVGLTLNEIARRFNSPVSEEQAWAVCHLTSSKLSEMQWPSKCSMETVAITTDGTVELLQQKRKDQDDLKMVIESLGIMIYTLLDYGLPDDQERTLSQPLEGLIEMMTELNSPASDELENGYGIRVPDSPSSFRTRDSGITIDNLPTVLWEEQLGRVIKTCELHVIELADPLEHYRGVCRGMLEEAINIMKLNAELATEEPDVDQSQDKMIAETWSNVLEDIKGGVQLKEINQPVDTTRNGVKVSDFDLFLMSIAKFDKSRLNKVELDESGKPKSDHPRQMSIPCIEESLLLAPNSIDNNLRRASVGNMHSTLMNEIKTRPALKPVSQRKLRPVSLLVRPLTPMESLMEEILTPPPLKKVERKSPKRFSLSLDSYRKYRSNPDLLDIPSPTTPLVPPPSTPQPWDYEQASWRQDVPTPIFTFDHSMNSSSVPAPACPFPPSPTASRNLTHSLPASMEPPLKQSRAKLRRGSALQSTINKLSPDSREKSQITNIRKRRLSCPNILEEPQPAVMVTRCDTMKSANGFHSAPPTPSLDDNSTEHYDRDSPKFRQRPKQLQLTPTFGQPPVVRRKQNSRGGRTRIKSWACYNDPPHKRSRASSREVIPEESKSQVCLWNQPEHFVYPSHPPVHPPPIFTPSPQSCSPSFTSSSYYSSQNAPAHSQLPLHTLTPSPLSRARPFSITLSPLHSDTGSLAAPSDIILQLPQCEKSTSLTEVIHVRTTVTKAELYNLQLEDSKAFRHVKDQKVCFGCRKAKFSLFNQSHKCHICIQYFCAKCINKYSLRGSNTHPKLVQLFKETTGKVKAVYLCTPCFLYICPEAAAQKGSHNKEQYDC